MRNLFMLCCPQPDAVLALAGGAGVCLRNSLHAVESEDVALPHSLDAVAPYCRNPGTAGTSGFSNVAWAGDPRLCAASTRAGAAAKGGSGNEAARGSRAPSQLGAATPSLRLAIMVTAIEPWAAGLPSALLHALFYVFLVGVGACVCLCVGGTVAVCGHCTSRIDAGQECPY
jgi:hypothetical protein